MAVELDPGQKVVVFQLEVLVGVAQVLVLWHLAQVPLVVFQA